MIRLGSRRREQEPAPELETIRQALGKRSIVMVGLMGCGKSSVGRRLAARLSLKFVDADEEIEAVSRMKIPEIFQQYGEDEFRNCERRVIARLLKDGPQVLATGGGAYMNQQTRDAIKVAGVSIWLKAELGVLMRRVMKRDNRPLLQAPDPEGVMRGLMAERYPVYGEADLAIESREVPHEVIVDEIVAALCREVTPTMPAPRQPGAD